MAHGLAGSRFVVGLPNREDRVVLPPTLGCLRGSPTWSGPVSAVPFYMRLLTASPDESVM